MYFNDNIDISPSIKCLLERASWFEPFPFFLSNSSSFLKLVKNFYWYYYLFMYASYMILIQLLTVFSLNHLFYIFVVYIAALILCFFLAFLVSL